MLRPKMVYTKIPMLPLKKKSYDYLSHKDPDATIIKKKNTHRQWFTKNGVVYGD